MTAGADERNGRADSATIVVVDDTPEVLELVTIILEDEGYHVVACQDGTQAEATIFRVRPDLVILDLRIAGVGEWQILDAIKANERTRQIPVIICSGAVRELQEAEGRLRSQGCDILSKPFEIDDLLSMVKRHVGTA
ncbi:MAG: response regulator [Chloroflexi bacterium]|nr:response regulator [Chloroflexota bacterium]